MSVTGRSARGDINRLPCVFAAALHARCAVCGLAASRGDTPRERILCTQPLARANCAQLDGLMREKARFAVKARRSPLQFAPIGAREKSTVQRIQCGGLQGLGAVLAPEDVAVDVYRLLEIAIARPGGLEDLPFERILPAITQWRP